MNGNVWQALLFSAIAGLSTGIGSIVALFSKKTNKTFLSVSLGVSAGVMIFVAFAEMFAGSKETLSALYGDIQGNIFACLALFGGMLFILVLENFLPERSVSDLVGEDNEKKDESRLLRSGLMVALIMAIHNFPEGLTTFVAVLEQPELGLPVVVAIAIHNIPEGIAVSAPIFFATGSKGKAFLFSFLSGLAEPVGALLGYLVLMPFLSQTVLAVLYGVVGGVMLYISLAELLPESHVYAQKKVWNSLGVLGGMAVMAMSIILFMK